MTTFSAFFPRIRALFSNFRKRTEGREDPPSPPLVMRPIKNSVIWKANTNKGIISHSKSSAKQQYVVKYMT